MTDDREKLARTLVQISGNNPDELIRLPSGETTPLWEIAARSMDKLPMASLRTTLDARLRASRGNAQPMGHILRTYLIFKQALRGGWISPKDALPPRRDEDSVLSDIVQVKRHGVIREAQLLYGTPVGSHRWVFGPNDFTHVLDIQGWKRIAKKEAP